jgi:hypothetical protein
VQSILIIFNHNNNTDKILIEAIFSKPLGQFTVKNYRAEKEISQQQIDVQK